MAEVTAPVATSSSPKSPKSPEFPSPEATGSAPTSAPEVLEADPEQYDEADGDSAIGTAHVGSETTSLASSIFRYRVENGRTYHAYKAGAYFLPNDERENSRLDLQHTICIQMQDNQLYICPAGKDKPLRRVLDAGCGTGIWAMDFADEHPQTNVVGVDLSPIQPAFVPPNVEFFVDDIEEDWTFTTPFDFVYFRLLTGSIKNWPRLLRQAKDHLAPGGWVELCDPLNPMTSDDGTLPKDSAIARWNGLLLEASQKLGAGLDSAKYHKQNLIDAGYINVVQVEYKWPMNSWPRDAKYKELGMWTHENIDQALQALSLMLFTNVLGWTAEEIEVLLAGVRKDVKNRSIHGYWPCYTVYGQKPE